MTQEQRALFDRLFEEAAAIPETEWQPWLSSHCADPEVRAELESLLPHAAPTGGFTRPLDAAAAIGHRSAVTSRDTIGPYRIVGVLGEGGMGTVYEGVRDDDQFRQRVAIKVLRIGGRSELLRRRFLRERQILAELEHPHIARLFDGGTAADGSPYLVMERIDGEPLIAFAESRKLSIRQRLELFRQIAGAVQYAHQKLIVHRDLKPGNILVTTGPGGRPEPKLLDFGIAKLLDNETEAAQDLTATGFHLMTPDYASPEQVQGKPVTAASDVYSLGAVLYELLSGTRPHGLKSYDPAEIAERICLREVPPPSATGVAGLRGDLDTIVLKAMQKAPERRYNSAEQLSEDLRRHLDGMPVMARPDTTGYRMRKFAGRHWVGLGATAAVILALTAGVAVSLQQANLARQARRAAEINRDAAIGQRQRAEERLAQIVSLSNISLSEVYARLERLPGAMPARKELVGTTLDFLEKVSREAGENAPLRLALAKAYLRLGDLQGDPDSPNLGDMAGALRSFQAGAALLGPVSPAPDTGQRPEAAESLEIWSDLQNKIGKVLTEVNLSEARDTLQKAIRVIEAFPEGTKSKSRIRATFYLSLSRATRDLPEALRCALEAFKDATAAAQQAADDTGVQLLLSTAHTQVGFVHIVMEDPATAVPHYEESMRIRERLAREHPDDILFRRNLKLAYEHYAALQGASDRLSMGHPEIARLYYQKARPLEEADLADPNNHLAKFDYATYLFASASVDAPPEELAASLAALRQAAQMYAALAVEDPGALRYSRAVADTYSIIGRRLLAMGRYSVALAGYQQSFELAKRVLVREPQSDPVFRTVLAGELGIARSLALSGNRAAALDYARQAIRRAEARQANRLSPSLVADAYLTLAEVHRQFGECQQAVAAAQRSIQSLPPISARSGRSPNSRILEGARAVASQCPGTPAADSQPPKAAR